MDGDLRFLSNPNAGFIIPSMLTRDRDSTMMGPLPARSEFGSLSKMDQHG